MTPPPQSKVKSPVPSSSPGWSDNDDEFLDPDSGENNDDDIDLDQLDLDDKHKD